MDDLYDGWDGAVRGFSLLRDHVLQRIADGREGRYRRYDWNTGRVRRAATSYRSPRSARSSRASPPATATPTAGSRCGSGSRPPTRSASAAASNATAKPLRDHWLDWMRWEREYFAGQSTRDRAQVVVDGNPALPHDPTTELVAKSVALPHSAAS